MGCLSTTTVALLFWGLVCLPEASGFVAPRGVVLWKHAAHSRTAVSMTAEPSKPTSRREAIAAAAAGLLASVGGVSVAGAVVPESLAPCPTEGNCVSSTSFKLVMQGRYMAPWSYTGDTDDAKSAFSKLVEVLEKDPGLKIAEKDAEGLYVVAMGKSAVPPDGFDKIEFLFKPQDGLVSFRSKSMKDVYAGPVLVSDGGSNRNRLETLRKKLGWLEKGIDNYIRDQGIDSGTSRAKGYLSELGWRQGETQSYGEEDEY
eukprot:jgi/Undpi1/13074/HiC_scaffold_8.g02736.m1